jgi:transposase InsO family protein
MEERMLFVVEAQLGAKPLSALCRERGISRKTGYKWLKRYDLYGIEGCRERSRAPLSCPHKTHEMVVQRLIELRRIHPVWGPKKLAKLLANEMGLERSVAPSTAGDILKRHNLVQDRKKKREAGGRLRESPLTEPGTPNDVWAADYKGWFRTQDGLPCHPLTVTDLYSRSALWCMGHLRQSLASADRDFDEIFTRNGLPRVIRVDNGTPFGSTGLFGITKLSLKWLRLGIDVEFIHPGKPQQNGSHERMHRTLKLEAIIPPANTLAEQQRRFDNWRKCFNEYRPHEALGQQTPASLYKTSSRIYNGCPEFQYPGYFETRYVRHDGMFSLDGTLRHIGGAFAKERVGLIRDHEERWLVYAGEMLVGWLSGKSKEVRSIGEL